MLEPWEVSTTRKKAAEMINIPYEPAKSRITTTGERSSTRNPYETPDQARGTRSWRARQFPGGATDALAKRRITWFFRELDRDPASRTSYLESILKMAVDPRALKEVMSAAGFERSTIMTGATEIASRSRFRVQEIAGTQYILCPVPSLYDEEYNIESGFAIDVDQDHFSVHGYMHDRAECQSIIGSKLAHWAYRPVVIDAINYDDVTDEIKEVANEISTMYLVNSLVADAAAESAPQMGIFDDKLHSQLLDCLVRIEGPRWINRAAIGKKFEQIMGLFKNLDASDPFYRNNKLRAFVSLALCIFGAPEADMSQRYTCYLRPGIIKFHEGTIRAYIESADFLRFLSNCRFFESPLKGLFEIFSIGGLRVSKEFAAIVLDFIEERKITGLEYIAGIGRHPDYVTVYQRAARMARGCLGSKHPATKLINTYHEACKLRLERQAGVHRHNYEDQFKVELERVSRAGSENIPFDQVDVIGVPDNSIGIVLDGIDSMANHPDAARGIGDASTWFRLGRFFDRLRSRPDAVFSYKAAIVHKPGHAIAWYNLHIAHEEAGNFKESRRCVEIALRENPFNPGAWVALGSFEEFLGYVAEAETCFRTAVSLKRDIDADPTLVETRISASFWEGVEDGLRQFLQKHRK